MISDLTKIGLKSLNKQWSINCVHELRYEQSHVSYKDCRALVLTGTALERSVKRVTRFHTEHQCECCGRFYIQKPWYRTYGLCETCYKREFLADIKYYEQPKIKWRFGSVNNTRRILDLWNRCY